MALINTSERSRYASNTAELIGIIRGALVEELAATNTYDDIISCVRSMGISPTDDSGNRRDIPEDQLSREEAQDIVKLIEEIRDDELHHTGKLLSLIEALDSHVAQNMKEGAGGL